MPQIPLPSPLLIRRAHVAALSGLTAVLIGSAPSAHGTGTSGGAAAAAAATPSSLAAVEQGLQQAPQDAALRFSQARLLENAGRMAEAAQAWQRMTQEFPQLAEPFNNLAVRRAADGDLDAARPLLEQALVRDPAYRLAHLNLAEVLLAQAQRALCLAADSGPTEPTLATRLQSLAALRGSEPTCPPAWRHPAPALPR